jgi:hypothetical protein
VENKKKQSMFFIPPSTPPTPNKINKPLKRDLTKVYLKLDVLRLTCLGRESNPGLRGGWRAL